MKLRTQLALLLSQHDMTASQLGRKANVPIQTISNWLAGKAPKNIEQVKRCANTLGVSLDFLLFADNPTNKNALEEHRDEIVAGVYEVVLRKPKR